MWPLGDRDGQCGVMVRVTQTQGVCQPAHAPRGSRIASSTGRRGRPLVFTYFALPDRIRELAAPGESFDSRGASSCFQILYRYAVVGPMFTSTIHATRS